MKITKEQLKSLIREELSAALDEGKKDPKAKYKGIETTKASKKPGKG